VRTSTSDESVTAGLEITDEKQCKVWKQNTTVEQYSRKKLAPVILCPQRIHMDCPGTASGPSQ
jgi:hypothetical protein